jgi:protein-S-isoprenylcysteine O-methyltransferase Ste14
MSLYFILLTSLTALWVAFEIWLMVRDKAQGKGKTAKDRGTRYYDFIAVAVGLTIAGFLNGKSSFFFPWGRRYSVFWIGFAIMLLSLSLRIWAITTLGSSFRTTVETHQNQEVVRKGPYTFVRHPFYTGLLLTCLGYGIAVQNWLSLLFAVGLPLIALLYRIHVEEAVLLSNLGSDYEKYERQTKKLIPWIW